MVQVESIHLSFSLNDDADTSTRSTQVTSTLRLARRANTAANTDLIFDCEDIALQRVAVNGVDLSASQYIQEKDVLRIAHESLPTSDAEFTVETVSALNPASNLQLSGLYKSSGMFCTQCEAEGFRRITPYFDRPDVMTT